MKWDTREPCGNCPYRKDAKLGLWDKGEFDNVMKQDADPISGDIFGCHATVKAAPVDRSVCAGWLLDQKRRGLPSIKLRLKLMKHEEAVDCLEQTTDGGHELYDSIAEMVQANEDAGLW